VSSHLTLTLHYPEETVACDFASVLVPYPPGSNANPITDYFSTAANLVKKIIDTKYSNDAEVLGLLMLGILSCAEFYFRSVLSELARVCPICKQLSEGINIPAGSFSFYADAGLAATMSAFEHESLADSKKVVAEIKRFGGFNCAENTSVKRALDDFEQLCELRHCFVHARGFVGLKTIRAIEGPRTFQKLLIKQSQALDFIKLSHNAVRAVNRYLGDEILNRWIDRDVLVGKWANDKKLFTRYWDLFAKHGEDAYLGSPHKSYAIVRPIILKRRQAIAANVQKTP